MRVAFKPDEIDAENVRSLQAHAGFDLVRKRLQKALAQSIDSLVGAKTWEDARRIQGVIEGVKLALDMPDAVLAEIRKSK